MDDGSVIIIKASETQELLTGRELDLIDAVRRAYETHALGDTSLPHSTFLHFPDDKRSRIIALPAYLGGEFKVAGIKWISSFPSNHDKGLDRAAAVVILNSTVTGRPQAIIEGSLISAKRTAASAALAAQYLKGDNRYKSVGMVGCSLINFEVARFLLAACPEIRTFTLFDLDETRANLFKDKCQQTFKELEIDISKDLGTVLRSSPLISIATTAITPHIFDLSDCAPGSVILHISLRDLSPEVILSCDNVVDDVDHVCRAHTSIHLAAEFIGHREFIRCTLGDILLKNAPARDGDGRVTVFSPFGLGILDLAVAEVVRQLGAKDGCGEGLKHECGEIIKSFLPDSWAEQK